MLNASRLITVIGSILGATSSSNKWNFAYTVATIRAMIALGVSGPIEWGIRTLYAGGFIACNHS